MARRRIQRRNRRLHPKPTHSPHDPSTQTDTAEFLTSRIYTQLAENQVNDSGHLQQWFATFFPVVAHRSSDFGPLDRILEKILRIATKHSSS